MSDTHRLQLPLLAAGQAQKEMTHNEALARIDIAVQPVVAAIAPAAVPESPTPGQSWIVGGTPAGAWAGQAHAIAAWTGGGWRFLAAFEGLTAWSLADQQSARFDGGAWIVGANRGLTLTHYGLQVVGGRQAAVTSPTGGSVVDTQARSSIDALRSALQQHGLIWP